jgi:hypothetical protein
MTLVRPRCKHGKPLGVLTDQCRKCLDEKWAEQEKKGERMGNTFEVWSWVRALNIPEMYEWVQLYAGEDRAEAFDVLERAKDGGAPCVKLEWR